MRYRTELLLLVASCGFLLFYGLGSFGLVGADEPRYAQVAREMLDRHDWITPTINGKPWLEKPPLYYWQAIAADYVVRTFSSAPQDHAGQPLPPAPEGRVGRTLFSAPDGRAEQAARFPGALDAALLVVAIYFFLRHRKKNDPRPQPSSEVDAALIVASSAGIIAFAHAASTDMPLTATFTIALLAWFSWYERRRPLALALFYFFLALGTLAKGPIAPVLAAVIVTLFAALRRDWRALQHTLWLPGIALFLAVSLPWYIAVQLRNPDFFRVFILQHNLARFSTNLYQHPQPFWFYLPVFALATMPWTLWLILALVERLRLIWRERHEAFTSPDDAWPLFLLIWIAIPILFFSVSQSKLPGYILPSVPAAALLIADYLAAHRESEALSAHRKPENKLSPPLAIAHAILCGLLIFAALIAPSIAVTHHLTLNHATYIAAAIAAFFTLAIAAALLTRNGPRLLREATLLAAVVSVAAIIRLAAPIIDATQSSRPVAETIQAFSREPVPVALYHVSRLQQYGLDFYLNRPTQTYETLEAPGQVPLQGHIPAEAHVLLAAPGTGPQFTTLLPGRKVAYLTSIPAQKLELYWIGK